MQAAISVRLDPRDVVADGVNFPAFEAFGRNEHGKIGLAARARKRCRDVGLFAFRILDADDQHVLGHPAFVTRNVRRNAQRKTLLAQQGVPAISRSVRPNFANLGKVTDVLFVVTRPRHVLLAGFERRAYAVHARHDAFVVFIDLRINRHADARHNPHVHDDVGRVSELHAYLRHRRSDGTHAERQHVHRASAHRTVEHFLQTTAHRKWLFPIVGWASRIFRERADEGAIFNARHIRRMRARVIATRPKLFVELDKRAALDHLGLEHLVFFD